jgi:amino acid transporter
MSALERCVEMSTDAEPPLSERVTTTLLGKEKSVKDPKVFHAVSLVAFFAWVGLGADGLSSSSYGPEEMFKALGTHTSLAVALAVAAAATVLIISLAYSRIIERFPFGGGGYVVATKLLGPSAGVVSGAALMVDYVLTITTSIAAGADAVFSFVPPGLAHWKLVGEGVVIGLLVLLNLRGVKESVAVLTPIFLLFLLTHVVLLGGGFLVKGAELPQVARDVGTGLSRDLATLGAGGMLALFLRAYSMGAGTYTGIEAVSNGLQIMREPRVQTGKRTMLLMATSLALTAGGVTLCYLLLAVAPVDGKTMNAVLAERFVEAAGWTGWGGGFVTITLVSEATLLFVAAQAGFIDGPRVMANMATDSWAPHRFAALSSRLTNQNGVLLMGATSLAALLYTRGHVSTLVSMYSINVFVTFSLSQAAMLRYWWRQGTAGRTSNLALHGLAFVLCATILALNVYEKFFDGGDVTILVTAGLVGLCFLTRRHYARVRTQLGRLDEVLAALPTEASGPAPALDPKAHTMVLLVGGYSGLGVHSLLAVLRLFPGLYRNVVFLSVGVVDSATFKNVEEVDEVERSTRASLEAYVALAHRLGLAATSRMALGTEVVPEAERLCRETARDFPRSLFFAGKLIFQREGLLQRLLHNESAVLLQRQLQFAGLNAMVLPVRVMA